MLILCVLPPSTDLSQVRCVSLACYSIHDLHPHTIKQSESHRHWFEVAKLIPFTKILRVLWFLMNNKFTFFYPPYEVRLLRIPSNQPLTAVSVKASEDLFDISNYVQLGENKLCFTQIDSMAEYVLVLYHHQPTQSQIEPVHELWDERKRFREQLAWLARPISPTI